MLERCYSDKYHAKRSTYIECEASDNFKNFQYFAEWCNNQIGFGLEGYQLDKDIITSGNKIYSEYTCVFVPRLLNIFFKDSSRSRGNLPIGVYLHNFKMGEKSYSYIKAQMYRNGKQTCLGIYPTPEAAFAAYKEAKEVMAKQLAIKWAGMVDDRVITALNNFEVHYND
jgi:hypothetical protein